MHRFERWRSAILVAADAQALQRIVRDYASCITSAQLEKLTQECRAVLAHAGQDISGSAVTLVREELRYHGDHETAELLHEIAQTFAAAATRHRQILAAASTTAAASR